MKMLMGNEAIAEGAIAAGVSVVTGYPGTPSTEVLETVAKRNDGSIYVEWSVNEKAALEVAAGAAYAGARSMVTMKQVGLNVASDPLMSLVYVGIKGGMVVLVADDPGPLSSQTEQDTRHFGKYANIPVFDPSSPEEAYQMVQDAFDYSEKYGIPVFLRPTTRICHSCASVEAGVLRSKISTDRVCVSKSREVAEERQICEIEGFVKSSRFVIFPALTRKRHAEIEEQQAQIAGDFSGYRFNELREDDANGAIETGNGKGKSKRGVIASGIAAAYMGEVMERYQLPVRFLKIATPFPLPDKLIAGFLDELDEVLVLEELDPVLEEGLIEIAYRQNIHPAILGKKTGHLPKVSEYSFEIVKNAVAAFTGIQLPQDYREAPADLPVRPPVLCAGCPHRASFYAVKQAMKGEKAVFSGDIGCYTLGNAMPLDMCDTCLCMGASATIPQGLQRAEPDVKHFGFIGDSTFFHTGIPGVINALYNDTDITLIVLDNATTAMTGHQPHPGIGKTMMRGISEKIDIATVLKGLGVGFVEKANPFEQKTAIEVVRRAAAHEGVSVVIFEAPCIALLRDTSPCTVDDTCKKCGKCAREIGCPAIRFDETGRAVIEPSLCTGCGLCRSVCPFGAIRQPNDPI